MSKVANCRNSARPIDQSLALAHWCDLSRQRRRTDRPQWQAKSTTSRHTAIVITAHYQCRERRPARWHRRKASHREADVPHQRLVLRIRCPKPTSLVGRCNRHPRWHDGDRQHPIRPFATAQRWGNDFSDPRQSIGMTDVEVTSVKAIATQITPAENEIEAPSLRCAAEPCVPARPG